MNRPIFGWHRMRFLLLAPEIASITKRLHIYLHGYTHITHITHTAIRPYTGFQSYNMCNITYNVIWCPFHYSLLSHARMDVLYEFTIIKQRTKGIYIWWDHPRVASLKMVSNVHGRDACANIHRTIEHFNTT